METGSDSCDSNEVIEVDGSDAEEDATMYLEWVRSCPHLRPFARAEMLARAVADSPPIARAELLARAVSATGNHRTAPADVLSMQYWADERPRVSARLLAALITTDETNRVARSPGHVRNEVTPNRGSIVMRNGRTANRGARLLADLIAPEETSRVAGSAGHVRNQVTPNRGTNGTRNGRTPSRGARLLANLVATEETSRVARSAGHVRNEVTSHRGTIAMGNVRTPSRGHPHVHAPGAVHPFDQVQHTIVPVFTLDDRMIAWREALPRRGDDSAERSGPGASLGEAGLTQ
jgi:hypothetical protein